MNYELKGKISGRCLFEIENLKGLEFSGSN